MSAELEHVDVPDEVLRYHNLNRNEHVVQVLLLVCARYGLDPLLAHASVIATKQGRKVYVTRDGYLHLAQVSGVLDGMTTVEEWQNAAGTYVCTVYVWARGRSHPFEGRGYCDPGEAQHTAGQGRAQARARAERRALRWVVPMVPVADQLDTDDEVEAADAQGPNPTRDAVTASPSLPAGDAAPNTGVPASGSVHERQRHARVALAQLDPDHAADLLTQYGVTDRGAAWPDELLAELLDKADA